MSTQPSSPSRTMPRVRGPIVFGELFRNAMSELSKLYGGTNRFDRKRAAFLRGYMRTEPDSRDRYADEYREMRARQVRR